MKMQRHICPCLPLLCGIVGNCLDKHPRKKPEDQRARLKHRDACNRIAHASLNIKVKHLSTDSYTDGGGPEALTG